MSNQNDQSLFSKVLSLYPHLSLLERLYLRLRLLLLDVSELERQLPREGRIIDLGCGYGHFANALVMSAVKRKVVGVDLDPNRIEKARRSVGERSGIAFLSEDVNQWRIPACDGIAIVDILHYFPVGEQNELLDRCYRSLVPGGKLLVREVDMQPWPKFYFTYLQEWLFTRIRLTKTKGRGLFFRSSAEINTALQALGFTTTLRKENKFTPYSQYVIVGSKEQQPR